ncbi:MAG: hypothetical protein PHC51_03200 [bacterium]|nr:hypothetical protein [bacterium]
MISGLSKLYKAASLGVLRDRTWECIRRFDPGVGIRPLTWPLADDLRNRLTVLWPRSYSWAHADKWLCTIRAGLNEHVPLHLTDICQPEGTKVRLLFRFDKNIYPVIIDYSDYIPADELLANNSMLYFKMQFSSLGYNSSKIVPGGYVPNDQALYRYLHYLRRFSGRQSPIFEVYGRFGVKTGGQKRKNALELLNGQSCFTYFSGNGRFVRYSRFLREAVQARVVIDLPGNGDLCFRLVDYLAIGACVISPEHSVVLHVPLEHRKHVHFCRPNLSDFLDSCLFYLDNDDARLELRKNSHEFFMRYLHRTQLGSYYLHKFLVTLENKNEDSICHSLFTAD